MQYYDVLGLSRNAEPQVIDAAYKAMMRRYHPDVFDGSPEYAEQKAKSLNEAYQTLKDPVARAAYDRTLDDWDAAAAEPSSPPRSPEPWEWESDPLGLRTKPLRRENFTGWKIAGGVFATFFVLAIVQDINGSSGAEASPVPIAASEAEGCKGADCLTMTPFGWGGVEAGVTIDSAMHSSGLRLRDDGHYTDVGDGSCLAYEVVGGPDNLRMLVENGVISTVEVYQDDGAPIFRTDKGVRLGDPESAVRAAYTNLKQLPNIYSSPPDKMLFHYEPGGERGVKFSIIDGKVASIAVGTQSIEYVEGCL